MSPCRNKRINFKIEVGIPFYYIQATPFWDRFVYFYKVMDQPIFTSSWFSLKGDSNWKSEHEKNSACSKIYWYIRWETCCLLPCSFKFNSFRGPVISAKDAKCKRKSVPRCSLELKVRYKSTPPPTNFFLWRALRFPCNIWKQKNPPHYFPFSFFPYTTKQNPSLFYPIRFYQKNKPWKNPIKGFFFEIIYRNRL